MMRIVEAETEEDYVHATTLFKAYAASLDFDLGFQDFARELANLPRMYGPPNGCVLLAAVGGELAGCVALRRLDLDACEMKRLYVKPQFRGLGLGRMLAQAIIERARKIGYASMRLDTIPSMAQARKLYQSLGFTEIQPYRHNPIEGAVFLERPLPP
jgi:ribosomal protein S18 acetylase RimI-like enzyme